MQLPQPWKSFLGEISILSRYISYENIDTWTRRLSPQRTIITPDAKHLNTVDNICEQPRVSWVKSGGYLFRPHTSSSPIYSILGS